ncbi:MAG: YaiI/YqxD family protein [Anaerovoracaceae bacterium]
MKILIDGDGCPVVDATARIARENKIECIILCDTAHYFQKEGAKTITVSRGADSVDFALVNMVDPDDIVVTQDYGLAAMCLAKGAIPISQDGMIYTNENIDDLLMNRHMSKKARQAGIRLKGNSKRRPSQDAKFEEQLKKVIMDVKAT